MGRGEEDGESGSRDAKRRRKNEGEGAKKNSGGTEGDSRTAAKEKTVVGDTFQLGSSALQLFLTLVHGQLYLGKMSIMLCTDEAAANLEFAGFHFKISPWQPTE
ncbi:hypothetical protein E2C01_005529 [Portunus trituberculatus]|uniref:Uncharacterized protein n=1 Tax=Portunus trituberculatus TaxID=210409 RepID=A0A5B7CUL0_PORTR|nr:hypothetical protein [Portunus trituberculatus]